MHIALDGRTLGPHETGVGRSVRLLATSLAGTRPAQATLEILLTRAIQPQVQIPGLKTRGTPVRPTWHPFTEIWEAAALYPRLRRAGIQVFHAPAFRTPWMPGLARVTTVHDLVAFRYPETVSRKFRLYLQVCVRHALRRADLVICPTEAIRSELIQRFPRHRAPIKAIAWGTPQLPRLSAAEAQERRRRLGLPDHYVLGVGAGEARKNHLRLLEAFARTRSSLQDGSRPSLVLCGAEAGDGLIPEQRCIDRLGMTSYIQRIGYLELRDMSAVYQGAIALAYPSLYEGFGLPILEAMALGVPVLTSNRGAMSEVAGQAAVLADPQSVESLSAALESLLRQPQSRQEWVEKGQIRAAQFDWQDTARHHWAEYAKLGTARIGSRA